jgi:hypothetical protein
MTPRTLEDDQATNHSLYTTNAISRMFTNPSEGAVHAHLGFDCVFGATQDFRVKPTAQKRVIV